MNILFLSAEVAPYVSVGGLSQVMYFLPRALIREGHDVRVFTPFHGATGQAYADRIMNGSRRRWHLDVPVSHDQVSAQSALAAIPCEVYAAPRRSGDAQVYFLDNAEYFQLRANVFGYADDHTRFALLSKAALEWLCALKASDWKPDIIHCHDWHTAYAIELARKHPRYQAVLKRIPIVLTVHNFRYQGNADFRYISEEKKDALQEPLLAITDPALQYQNALMRGLSYADAITTVSPTHAVEVLSTEYAEGLEDTLHAVQGKLSGILNGLDVKEFNPKTDPNIKKRFDAGSFERARGENKKDLQKAFGLPVREDAILFAYSGRLSAQKGIDLLSEAIPHFLMEKEHAQFVALGSGEDRYRAMLQELSEKFPEQVGLHLHADFILPRKMFAGADVQLIPSMFEPGGIVALEAMRYGAIPLVRVTGGLADAIRPYDPQTKKGNGFCFQQKDPWSLYGAMAEAATLYRDKRRWRRLVANALSCDFSWEYAAREYANWYKRALEKRPA